MVSAKKYPTAIGTNSGGQWTNAANGCDGLDDGTTCAVKVSAIGGIYEQYYTTYGFAIPAGAIIDNVFIDHKSVLGYTINPSAAEVSMILGITRGGNTLLAGSNQAMHVLGGQCAATAYAGEVDVQPILNLTVAEINAESFFTWIEYDAQAGINAAARFDAFYVRVVYHLPVVSFTETLFFTDALTRRLGYSRKNVESLTITDRFSYVYRAFKKVLTRALTETLIITDTLKRNAAYTRKSLESLVVRDSLRRTQASARRFSESLFIQNVLKRVANYPRRLKEDLSGISDRLTRRVAYMRKPVETVFVQDVLQRIRRATRLLKEDLSVIQDFFARRVKYTRSLLEDLSTLKDILVRPLTSARLFIETMIVSVLTNRKVAYNRNFVETVYIQAKSTITEIIKAIRKWLAYLARRLRLTSDHPQHAEFDL